MSKPKSGAIDVKLQLQPPKIKPLISFSTLDPQIIAIRQQQEALRERDEKQLVKYLIETKFFERMAEIVKNHMELGISTSLVKPLDSNKKFLALALEFARFLYKLYPHWTVEQYIDAKLFYYAGVQPISENVSFSLFEARSAWGDYNDEHKLYSTVGNYFIWQEIEDAVANHYILIQQGKLPKVASIVGGSGILWIKQRLR